MALPLTRIKGGRRGGPGHRSLCPPAPPGPPGHGDRVAVPMGWDSRGSSPGDIPTAAVARRPVGSGARAGPRCSPCSHFLLFSASFPPSWVGCFLLPASHSIQGPSGSLLCPSSSRAGPRNRQDRQNRPGKTRSPPRSCKPSATEQGRGSSQCPSTTLATVTEMLPPQQERNPSLCYYFKVFSHFSYQLSSPSPCAAQSLPALTTETRARAELPCHTSRLGFHPQDTDPDHERPSDPDLALPLPVPASVPCRGCCCRQISSCTRVRLCCSPGHHSSSATAKPLRHTTSAVRSRQVLLIAFSFESSF